MYTVINDKLELTDARGMTVANFLICNKGYGDPEGFDPKAVFVIGTPTRGICEYADGRDPLVMLGGRWQFTPEGFLDWLAELSAYDRGEHFFMTLRGMNHGVFYTITLRVTMDTQALINLLEFPDEITENWLKRHVTFRDV